MHSQISWTLCVTSQALYISSIKINIFVSQPYTVKISHHLVFSFSRAKLPVPRGSSWSRTVPKCISRVVQQMQCSMKWLGVVPGRSNSLLCLQWAFDICSLFTFSVLEVLSIVLFLEYIYLGNMCCLELPNNIDLVIRN